MPENSDPTHGADGEGREALTRQDPKRTKGQAEEASRLRRAEVKR